ncbi:unnamed protein product [Brassica rapa subsp. narinosa]
MERLINEIAEIRHVVLLDEERLESQKCLVEEERKNKTLSEQVGKIKELISEGVPHYNKNQSGRTRKTPESPQVTTSMMKRSRQTEDIMETDMVSPHISSSKFCLLIYYFFAFVSRKRSWFLNHNAVKQLTVDK